MVSSSSDADFIREYKHIIDVKSCDYFKTYLKSMVNRGKMFAAIRENTLDFYYLGRRAVRRTKTKYRINKFYIEKEVNGGSSETSLSSEECLQKHSTLLGKCKEKAQKSGREAMQISKLYEQYSFLSRYSDKNKPVLIDIEVHFTAITSIKKYDRIDLVFFMPKKNALMFVEVKRRKDSRIRASENMEPEVIEQVKLYRNQIKERKENIIEAYKNVAKTMNEIFGCSFPEPTDVISDVPILVVNDPGEDTTDKSPKRNVRDAWLEPKLASLGNDLFWEKDEIHLIDGREIFNDCGKMPELAKILEDISEKMQ
jgi:hypothetical protein